MEVSPPLTRRSDPEYDRATVADAMHAGVFTCDPATPLVNVAQRMAGERVHAIIVMTPGDGERRPWGVVTDLELIRRAARITETTAGEAAAQSILTVRPGDRLAQVAARLLVRGATHALVVDPDSERPVGVLSTLDVIGVLAGRST